MVAGEGDIHHPIPLHWRPMAETAEEERRRRRRKRLTRGLVLGGLALGIPAAANAVISRRARRLPVPRWGDVVEQYEWRGHHIKYQVLGEGESEITLLHSLGPGHSSIEWRAVAEHLAACGHRVLIPDLLGWGDSDMPDLEYDAGLYVALLSDFLSSRLISAPDDSALVAAGASVAFGLGLALDHPGLVDKLALITPQGVPLRGRRPTRRDTVVQRLIRVPILGRSALNFSTSRSALDSHLSRELLDPSFLSQEQLDEYYRISHLPGARHALGAYLSGQLDSDLEARLSDVRLPTLVIWGRESAAPPVESADLWLRLIEPSRLVVVSGSGGLPHLEQPEATAESLRGFIE